MEKVFLKSGEEYYENILMELKKEMEFINI